MPIYAKFIKDLITRKWTVGFDPTDNVYYFSTIDSQLLVDKKKDPRAFTTLCTIGYFNFAQALCDLESSINLMPLVIYT